MTTTTTTTPRDATQVLGNFPRQLRAETLMHVMQPLLDSRPTFLNKCPPQLLRDILASIRPTVALKKQCVLKGGAPNKTIFILLRGSLRVTPSEESEVDARKSKASPGGKPKVRRTNTTTRSAGHS